MAKKFRNREAFGDPGRRWELFPFSFLRLPSGRELLVNEVGEYLVAPHGTVQSLVGRTLDRSSPVYADLQRNHFLWDGEQPALLELFATKWRTKKAFLSDFTTLHMVVLTLRCDHSCAYCQVSRQTPDRTQFDMSEETAARAVELMFRSPGQFLTLEFQGGEAFLCFELLREVTLRAKRRADAENRHLDVVVATNLAMATDEMLEFCRDHGVLISTSLDGPCWLHNVNRARPEGDSHTLLERRLAAARRIVGEHRVSALMTTTRASLEHPEAIIDEYVRLGFRTVFIRPLRAFGFAVKTANVIGYRTDQFLEFWMRGLRYIIDLNRRGIPISETYSRIVLNRILTPFATSYVDLQSPPGIGIAGVIYNYDGDVYASDEGRMLAETGDRTFCLGNVNRDSYERIFLGDRIQELVRATTAESIPGCASCALLPFCGSDPVGNHAACGDVVGHRPTSDFCQRNRAVMIHLLEILEGEDQEARDILISWGTGVPYEEVRSVGTP